MKQDNKEKLFEVADRQQGYFTSQQAEGCGYSRSNFHRFLKSGEWVRETRGIYKLSRYPIQNRSELVLWTLWSRNKKGESQGIWSHETALDIHELSDVMPAKMHMTVPRGFRKNQTIPKHLVLHYDDLSKTDMEARQGYCVTTPRRTLIDIAKEQSLSLDQTILALEQALERGLISKREIQRDESAQILSDILDRFIQ